MEIVVQPRRKSGEKVGTRVDRVFIQGFGERSQVNWKMLGSFVLLQPSPTGYSLLFTANILS